MQPASDPRASGAQPAHRQKSRVLLVEDEADLVSSLSYSLQAAGYQVSSALDGATALRLATAQPPDIVLLDLMLPDISGLEVCRRIRASGHTPQPIVIMVTARGEEVDRVVGFEVGADDYLVKPFSVRELLLRMEARQRAQSAPDEHTPAAGSAPNQGRITVGSLEVDPDSHQVFVGGNEIHVSALEMRLLLHLLEVPGKVRYRRQLLTEVWGYHPEVSSRTLDTHVKRLRHKLADAAAYIHTVRGVGYRIVAQPATSEPCGRHPERNKG
ncbi:MAG: response regulator transcription factor [Polyangia bacterium]|jgi:two-component system phosphate regulon response regulator PhoB